MDPIHSQTRRYKGVGGQHHAPAIYPREISPPLPLPYHSGFRPPERTASSEFLYRIRRPGTENEYSVLVIFSSTILSTWPSQFLAHVFCDVTLCMHSGEPSKALN
jgi:hypothetical protein